jgi:polyisoprenoid-binding protein YceI
MMQMRNLIAATLLALPLPVLADNVVTYTIDPNHSQVHFSWVHVGFSTPSADFTQVTGTILGNHDHPEKSSVEVTMPVKSLDTKVPLLNDHLINSGDYFKTAQYPDVTFKSTGITDVNRKKKTFHLHGDLTVNGITKPVVLDAVLNKVGPHPFYENAEAAGFNATTTLKRSEFGIDKYVPLVSDELKVSITVEAIEAGAYQKAMDRMKADAAKK